MSHLENEKKAKPLLKSAVRNIHNEPEYEGAENRPQILNIAGDKIRAVKSETELFYEKILKNSLDKNTALQMKSYDSAEEGDWTLLSVKKPRPFTQKLPAARDTYKARKAEDDAVKEAKKTFRNADLCTVREKAAIEEYFAKWQNGDPGIEGTDEPDSPELTEYVQSVLSLEFNNAIFTDDYLSDHMPEMFEYARKLRHFSNVKEKYPRFYAHLSDDKKAMLEARAAAASDLGKLLSRHMELHGLRVEPGADGYRVRLLGDSDDKRRRSAERDRLKGEYESRLKSFLQGRVYDEEIGLARIYTELDQFKSIRAAKELTGRLSQHIGAKAMSSYLVETASDEIKNAWKVRDSLIVDQRTLLGQYEDEKNDARKAGFMARIVRNNRRIRLATKHADHYKDFLDFITGQANGIKKGTVRFLKGANQGEFLSAISRKRSGEDVFEKDEEQQPVIQEEQQPAVQEEQQPVIQEEQQPVVQDVQQPQADMEQKKEEEKAESWGFEDKARTAAMIDKYYGIMQSRKPYTGAKASMRPVSWKKHRNTPGSIESRKAAGTAGCMSFLEGDDEEKSWQLYNGLTLKKAGLTREEKVLKTRALERVFEVFLKADVRELCFNKYKDLLSDRYLKVQVLSYMAFEFPNTFFDDYSELMKDPEAGCALTEDQYKEARTKWDFFYANSGAFSHFLEVAKCEGVTEEDFNNYLALSDEELSRGVDSNDAIKRMLSSSIINFKSSIDGDFGPGWDAGKAYDKFRKNAGLKDEHHEEDGIKAIRDRILREGDVPRDENDRDMTEEELRLKKAKEDRNLKNKRSQREAKEAGWEIVADQYLSPEEKKRIALDRERALQLSYESNTNGTRVSYEDFKKYGGAVRHKYVTVKDARRIEWKSEGYITAVESDKDGLMELRPSLPLRVMAGKKEVEFRRTYNYVIKAIHMALFDEKGEFRKNTQEILDAEESIFLDSDREHFDVKSVESVMKKYLLPEIIKSLKESYASKGERVSDRNINKEASRIISDWLLLQTESRTHFVSAGDFLFESRIRKIFRASQGDFDNWESNAGEAGFDERQTEEVRAYKKQELKKAIASLKKIASFDPEGKEVPLIGACSGHAAFIQTCMLNYNNKVSAMMYYDYVNGTVQKKVQEILEFVLSDYEGFIMSTKQTEESRQALRSKKPILEGYLDKLKKGEELTKKEMETYSGIVVNHISYNHHAAGKIFSETDDDGNTVTYTTESSAKNIWDTYAVPFSLDNSIGEYKGENHPVVSDDMTREMSADEYKKQDPDFQYTYHTLPRCRVDNEGFMHFKDQKGEMLLPHTEILQLNMRSNIT